MMKRYSWYDDAAITEMSALLRGGGVLVGSSDTVFGLLVSATDLGKQRLDEIKGRQNKPYLVLAENIDVVKKLVDLHQLLQIEKLLQACWPGPLTVILKTRLDVPGHLQSVQGSIAIRVPKHVGLQRLLAQTGILFSTSANKTGQSVPMTLDEMDLDLLSQVGGIVLDGEQSRSTLTEPSTIIDATGDKLVMVREGAYTKADLERLLSDGGKQF